MNLVYLDGKKEPYTTSEIIAECAELKHDTVQSLIRNHKDDLEVFGFYGFQIRKLSGRGRPRKIYHLNEQQATLLITYLDNTKPVREFKVALVKAFFEMRDELSKFREQRALEKPTHKTLNEAISKWDNAPKMAFPTVNNLLLKLSTGKNKVKLTEDRGGKTGLDCLTSVELAKYQAYEKAVIPLIELNMEYGVIRDTLKQVQLWEWEQQKKAWGTNSNPNEIN